MSLRGNNMEKYQKLSKEDINALPLIKYEGEVVVLSSYDNVQVAINDLMNYGTIGFDTETKPTFVKGPLNPPSIIQLARENRVYIFQLDNKNIFEALTPVLSNRDITKCGVSVDRDLIELMYLQPFHPLSLIHISEPTRPY